MEIGNTLTWCYLIDVGGRIPKYKNYNDNNIINYFIAYIYIYIGGQVRKKNLNGVI